MKKHHHPHHHKSLIHRLTPEQKARRKKRFKKAMTILLWLDPVSAPIMAAVLIAQKEKERKARKAAAKQAANAQADAIMNQLQVDMSSQAQPNSADNASPATAGQVAMTIDDLSSQAAHNPTADMYDPSGDSAVAAVTAANTFAEGWKVDGLSYDQVFADAKAKANAIADPVAKKETLDAIADAQKAVTDQAVKAKVEVKNADPMDVSQAKAELAKTDIKAVAQSVDSPKVEKVEAPAADEKKAIDVPPAAQLAPSATSVAASITGADETKKGIPTWAYWAGGLTLGGAAAYGIWYSFFKKKNG